MNEQRSTVRHHCPSGPRRQLFFLGRDEALNANVTNNSTQGLPSSVKFGLNQSSIC